ncbi:site-specific integrase [Cellulomonas sp.]|uniref:site-specific integrase n=1 Tax=Cellulomonas sp. TaxID=40001 RepID=UPI00258B2624|nr:site-specific integrase [Cellulomonas sp.]MCR6690060.1 site-specific integrase [Cellulomonas sp.]
MLLGTGMRRGEALALQWQNVDIDAGELRVRGTLVRTGDGLVIQPPKTNNGWRPIPLSPPVVAALKQQRQQQRIERLAAGMSWVATDYVFTTVAGTPLDPRNVSRWFSALAQRAGVQGSMHATRHTALSSMVNAGVPMPVVSRVAGHESINITVDIYGHVSEQAARDAVAAAASSLGL